MRTTSNQRWFCLFFAHVSASTLALLAAPCSEKHSGLNAHAFTLETGDVSNVRKLWHCRFFVRCTGWKRTFTGLLSFQPYCIRAAKGGFFWGQRILSIRQKLTQIIWIIPKMWRIFFLVGPLTLFFELNIQKFWCMDVVATSNSRLFFAAIRTSLSYANTSAFKEAGLELIIKPHPGEFLEEGKSYWLHTEPIFFADCFFFFFCCTCATVCCRLRVPRFWFWRLLEVLHTSNDVHNLPSGGHVPNGSEVWSESGRGPSTQVSISGMYPRVCMRTSFTSAFTTCCPSYCVYTARLISSKASKIIHGHRSRNGRQPWQFVWTSRLFVWSKAGFTKTTILQSEGHRGTEGHRRLCDADPDVRQHARADGHDWREGRRPRQGQNTPSDAWPLTHRTAAHALKQRINTQTTTSQDLFSISCRGKPLGFWQTLNRLVG